MTRFLRRFFGVVVLDAAAFEDIEANPNATMQSVVVVMLACAAGGFAATSAGVMGAGGFAAGLVMALGAWLVWATVIVALGTGPLAEPQTNSTLPELLRVLGFAAAPAVFVAMAAIRPAAPATLAIVSIWLVAATVVGVRQALDFRSTARALSLCVAAWLLSFGLFAATLAAFTQPVS